jgi:hypothetical protein
MTTHIPVSSSNTESVGYDPENKALEVKYKNGLYVYHDVTPDKYQALLSTIRAGESVGKHLNLHIKGSHRHTKVPG